MTQELESYCKTALEKCHTTQAREEEEQERMCLLPPGLLQPREILKEKVPVR